MGHPHRETRGHASVPARPSEILSRCSRTLRGRVQAPRRIGGRRRSQWFSHRSSAIARDSTGVLMPTGVTESRSLSQSSQTTIQRPSDRCTILARWTFRIARLLLGNSFAGPNLTTLCNWLPGRRGGPVGTRQSRELTGTGLRRVTRDQPHPGDAISDFMAGPNRWPRIVPRSRPAADPPPRLVGGRLSQPSLQQSFLAGPRASCGRSCRDARPSPLLRRRVAPKTRALDEESERVERWLVNRSA